MQGGGLSLVAPTGGEHLTLSGPYGRLLNARFGPTPQDGAVTVELGPTRRRAPGPVGVELVVMPPPPPAAEAATLGRAQSCDARLEATASESDTVSFSLDLYICIFSFICM